jgi:hypothetical protein
MLVVFLLASEMAQQAPNGVCQQAEAEEVSVVGLPKT